MFARRPRTRSSLALVVLSPGVEGYVSSSEQNLERCNTI